MTTKKGASVTKLIERADELLAVIEGASADEEPVAVKLVCARPVSAPESDIAVLSVEDKEELAWLESLEDLDEGSREKARRHLWRRYRIAKVKAVTESHVNHGHRYLRVQTDRGDRYFNLREPGTNVTYLSDDHLVVRDSMGNRYEVSSLAALDEESRENLERVL